MTKYSVFLAISVAAFYSTASFAQEPIMDQCVSLFKGSLNRVSTSSLVNIAIETIAKDSCSGSSFNLDAGFDSKTQALIDGVPGASSLLGNLGISSTKKLCEAYKSGRFTLTTDDQFRSEPVKEAMEQANKCIELASRRDVVLRHEVLDPGKIAFGVKFLTTERQLRFTVQTTGGFLCSSARPGTSKVEKVGETETIRKNDFTVSCERKGKTENGNTDYTNSAVSLNFGDIIYTVRINADSIYGANSRREADKTISEALETARKASEALQAALRDYAKRSYTSYIYYFGEHTQGGFGGGFSDLPRFGCEFWQNRSSAEHVAHATQQLCAGGVVKSITPIFSRGGNRCGYNYFNMICERAG